MKAYFLIRILRLIRFGKLVRALKVVRREVVQ